MKRGESGDLIPQRVKVGDRNTFEHYNILPTMGVYYSLSLDTKVVVNNCTSPLPCRVVTYRDEKGYERFSLLISVG